MIQDPNKTPSTGNEFNGINVFGHFQSEKGIGTFARSLLLSLKTRGISTTSINCHDAGSENTDMTVTNFQDTSFYPFNLFAALPPYIGEHSPKNYPHHYNIAHWCCETETQPKEWTSDADHLEEIWAPTQFVKKAMESCFQKPVIHISYPVSVFPSKGLNRKTFGFPEESVIFLFRFDMHSFIERKNPAAVISAFLEAFPSEENVFLVIHALHGLSAPDQIEKLESLCRNKKQEGKIKIIHQTFSKRDVDAMTSLCDVFVSLHRAEGFGFNIAEAMALGKPVIATGYSGNMDFMDQTNSIPVPFKLIPIQETMGPYKSGMMWAEPDIRYAAQQMRRLYENPSLRKTLGSKAALDIAKNHDPIKIGELMQKRLTMLQPKPFLNSGKKASKIGYPLKNFKISCIIPFHNGKNHLLKAVESVINQTLPPCEVIIINDGSIEEIPEAVVSVKAPFPIRIINQAQQGQSAARNAGVNIAVGEYIAFLDQDDIWYENHLERLAHPFVNNPKLGWSYSNLDLINEKGLLLTRGFLNIHGDIHPKQSLHQMLSTLNNIYPSAALVLKTAFIEAGGFNELLCGYEDDDLFTRLFTHGWGNSYIAEPLVQWRSHIHNTSRSSRLDASRLIYFRQLLKEWPDHPATHEYWVKHAIVPHFIRDALLRYFYICVELKEFAQCKVLYQQISEFIRAAPLHVRLKYRVVTFYLRFPRLSYYTHKALQIAVTKRLKNRLYHLFF